MLAADGVGLFGDLPLDQAVKRRVVGTCRQFGQHLAHAADERHGVDVGDVHRMDGDDELPAGGHDIIAGILLRVPFLHEPGDDHVVVAVLRESQPLAGELRPQEEDFVGRIRVDADVNLGVDQLQFAAGPQAHLREAVEKVVAVCGAAAQHHALAVVALLHTGIEVAVLVACEEELFHQVERLLLGQHAAVDVMAEIGVHVLVETPQRIVVIAGLPDREMEDAQQLQRLAQRPGAARTHGLEHLGRIRLPRLAGMGGVTPRKLLHGLDAERHRPQEDTLFLVERIVRQAGSDFGLPGIEPKADGGFVVGRYVADRPALVDVVRRLDPVPLLRGEDFGHFGNGAGEYDLLARQDHGLFGTHQGGEHLRRAPHGRHSGRCKPDIEVVQPEPGRGTAQDMVLFAEDIAAQVFDSGIHCMSVLRL